MASVRGSRQFQQKCAAVLRPELRENNALVETTIGTRIEIDTRDRIVVLETTDDHEVYGIDNAITHLRNAGKLDGVAGVVIGDMHGRHSGDTQELSLEDVLLGWAIVPVAGTVVDTAGLVPMLLLLIGGILYSVGAVLYATKWPNPWPHTFGHHEFFHAATVLAALCHAVAVWLVVFA